MEWNGQEMNRMEYNGIQGDAMREMENNGIE